MCTRSDSLDRFLRRRTRGRRSLHYDRGGPAAAGAAETEDAAEAAASLVRIDFEALPAVASIAAALDPSSPLVQDPELRGGDPDARTNTLNEWRFGWGDPDVPAACVIENTYTFPMVTHFAI